MSRRHRHPSGRGAAEALRRSRRAGHGLARCVLGERRAQAAVGLRLLGGGRPFGSCCHAAAAVEQAEDLSLQLLLVAGVGRGAGGGRQAEVAGLHGEVGRVGWSGKHGSRGGNVDMGCCRSWNVNCSWDIWSKKKTSTEIFIFF